MRLIYIHAYTYVSRYHCVLKSHLLLYFDYLREILMSLLCQRVYGSPRMTLVCCSLFMFFNGIIANYRKAKSKLHRTFTQCITTHDFKTLHRTSSIHVWYLSEGRGPGGNVVLTRTPGTSDPEFTIENSPIKEREESEKPMYVLVCWLR